MTSIPHEYFSHRRVTEAAQFTDQINAVATMKHTMVLGLVYRSG